MFLNKLQKFLIVKLYFQTFKIMYAAITQPSRSCFFFFHLHSEILVIVVCVLPRHCRWKIAKSGINHLFSFEMNIFMLGPCLIEKKN